MPAPIRFLLGAMALGLAALAAPAAAGTFRLITTDLVAPLAPNSVMDLAARLGYFAREGVEVELVRVQQTPLAVAALAAGEGDMANISVDAALQLVARDRIALKAVVSPNRSLPFLIAGRADIAGPGALAGRSFGIGRVGSLDHTLSTQVLRAMGVDVAAIDFVGLGQPNARAQALAAGRIDATTMSVGVWLSLPDRTGLAVLVAPDAYFAAAPVVNKVNVAPDAVLAAKPDQVEAVVRALVSASRDFAREPRLWAEAMAVARPDVDRATLDALAGQLAGDWSVNGGMNPDALQATAERLYAGPEFAGLRRVGLDEWVDPGVLAAVLGTEGVVPGLDPPGAAAPGR